MEKTNFVMKKLRSNEGASILLALLFLMVCLIAGSIVLASATAAAGRSTKLTDTTITQEQYATDSAASLLVKLLKDNEVTVQISGSKTASSMSGLESAPYDVFQADIVDNHNGSYEVVDSKDYDLLESTFSNYFKISITNDNYIKNDILTSNGSPSPFSIDVKSNGLDVSELSNVTMTTDYRFDKMIFIFTSGSGDNQKQTTLTAHITIHVIEDTNHVESPQESSGDSYKQIYTKIISYQLTDFQTQ